MKIGLYHKLLIFTVESSLFLTCPVVRPEYSGRSRSMQWLLMPWLLPSPGHQQPWYWLCSINWSLLSRRKNVIYLYQLQALRNERKCKCIFMFVPYRSCSRAVDPGVSNQLTSSLCILIDCHVLQISTFNMISHFMTHMSCIYSAIVYHPSALWYFGILHLCVTNFKWTVLCIHNFL